MSSTKDQFVHPILRPEAVELGWEHLHRGQKCALERIEMCLSDALKAPMRALSEVRRNPNRILFVSGPRGIGKTTLLLTLGGLAGRNSYLNESENFDFFSSSTRPSDSFQRRIRETFKQVIWLETIKLQHFEDRKGLLKAIRCRLADHSSPQQEGYDRWKEDLEKLELPFRSDFRQGFEKLTQWLLGSGKEAKSQGKSLIVLPVDDFDLNPKLILKALRLFRALKSPYFVIIIFGDIEVARSVIELKTISRFLGIGKTPSQQSLTLLPAEALAGLAGDIAANAIRKLLPSSQRIFIEPMSLGDALDYSPASVGGTTLRKLLLERRIAVNSAVRTEPAGGDADSDSDKPLRDGGPVLEQSLAGRRLNTLYDFLLVTAPDSPNRWNRGTRLGRENKPVRIGDLTSGQDGLEESCDGDLGHPVYPGAAFLHAPPRQLVDFWFELTKLKHRIKGKPVISDSPSDKEASAEEGDRDGEKTDPGESRNGKDAGDQAASNASLDDEGQLAECQMDEADESKAIFELFVKRFKEAVQEDARLSPKEKQQLINSLHQDINGLWELQTGAMRLVNDVGPERRILLPQQSHQVVSEIVIREARNWGISAKRDRADDRRGLQPSLADPATACLFILYDLLAFNRQVAIIGKQLPPTPEATKWVGAKWKSPTRGPVYVPWLTPPWKTFWEFSLFRNAWLHTCRYLRSDLGEFTSYERVAEYLFYRWAAAATGIIQAQPKSKEGCQLQESEIDFQAFCVELGYLFKDLDVGIPKKRITRPRLVDGWYCRLVSLLGPETGLPGLNLDDKREWSTRLIVAFEELRKKLERNASANTDGQSQTRSEHWRNHRIARIRRLRALQALRFWEKGASQKAVSLMISWSERIARINDSLEAMSPKNGEFSPPLPGFERFRIRLKRIAGCSIDTWSERVDRRFVERTLGIIGHFLGQEEQFQANLQKEKADKLAEDFKNLHAAIHHALSCAERRDEPHYTEGLESLRDALAAHHDSDFPFLKNVPKACIPEECQLLELRMRMIEEALPSDLSQQCNVLRTHKEVLNSFSILEAAWRLRDHALSLRKGEHRFRVSGKDDSVTTKEMVIRLRHLSDLLEYGLHPMNICEGGRLCPTIDEILELKRLSEEDPSILGQEEEGQLFF